MDSYVIPMLKEERDRLVRHLASLQEQLKQYDPGCLRKRNNTYYWNGVKLSSQDAEKRRTEAEDKESLVRNIKEIKRDIDALNGIITNRKGPKRIPKCLQSVYKENLHSIISHIHFYEEAISKMIVGTLYEDGKYAYIKHRSGSKVCSVYLGIISEQEKEEIREAIQKRKLAEQRLAALKKDRDRLIRWLKD